MPAKRKRPAAAATTAPGDQDAALARKECYDRILWEIRQGFATYAEAHPERVGDERWNQALECSMEGLAGIVAVLEAFDICPLGSYADVQEECRRLREDCGALRVALEGKLLGNGEEGEDP